MSFTWDGTEINTVGDLFDGAVVAMRAGRAQEFLTAYSATNEHAVENLGYMFGYADELTRAQLYAAYALVHPIFGTAV
jgi:predicted NAD/FAD-binding protein